MKCQKNDLRRVLSKSTTGVEEHHVCAVDVVHLVGVHRQQNTTNVCLGGKKKKKKVRKTKRHTDDVVVCGHVLSVCY